MRKYFIQQGHFIRKRIDIYKLTSTKLFGEGHINGNILVLIFNPSAVFMIVRVPI